MTTSSTNNSVFRGFFEKQKLSGPNFIDWYRQLRIVLSIEDKLNYLEQPISPAPVAPAEQELLQTTRDFHSCRQEEGQSVSSYVLKMKGYIDNLERFGYRVTLGLGVSLILIGLRKEYDGFVQNYNMHSMGKTVNELHAMLKLHEQTLSKSNAPALNAIRADKVQKELMKKKKNTASGAGGSGIFVIELNTILNRSWIYETGYGTHICNTSQGLRASRKLKPGALSLYVGNGQREAVKAIGVFYLCLPSGLDIVLNNCHYAPSITIGVISVSRFYEDGFVNRFVDNTIQVSRNNVVYFSDVPRDGIFEIDLFNSLTNESSIYAVSNKRAKLDLDSALLWHLFQKEIENQLGKTIKSLRFDRGGEYMSQEFLDHLKDHGIIAHRTPPYTPQHNGVSERRNRTLLDMVRSMMSQTTLPKSFWDYALEIAACIFNMVPNKKFEKTPYEVWHGKAPKLSYLKVWGCEALVKR
nr:zinc finger, CCHC-type [Tanacetum cinerariifolium]